MRENGTLWLPDGASTIAPEIDWLFYFVVWTSTVLFIGVVAAMVYFAYRYRRQRADERPQPVTENKLLEVAWIVVPTILVLLVFTWGFRGYLSHYVTPPNTYDIQVSGQMWNWVFEYPDGTSSTNELHVPVDRPVRLNMSSDDVIHSLFIPAFRVKQDVLPDRYTSLWFEATRTGEFPLFCAEYCGTDHSGMLATVYVHTEDEFAAWLDEAGVDEDMPLPELGEQLYTQNCESCHSVDGSQLVGPTFQGLYESERTMEDGETVTADENYLRESIIEPGARVVEGFQDVMPSFERLSEREVTALIAFIQEQD